MKRLSILAVALLFLAAFVTPASADTLSSAVASVFVQVVPAIAVLSTSPNVDLGAIQTGRFPAQLTWLVSANQEQVRFFLEASALFKGDDPVTTGVPKIPVLTSVPAAITAQFGNQVANSANNGANIANWLAGAGANIGNYPTVVTETVAYESSQVGDFSQAVTTVVTYSNTNFQQPMGQYSGKIRLTALF